MEDVKAGFGFEIDHTYEGDRFFFHIVFDRLRRRCQLVCVLQPYGEVIVDEYLTTYENPFKFSCKDLDAIIGLYVNGDRSRTPRFATWMVWTLFGKHTQEQVLIAEGNL